MKYTLPNGASIEGTPEQVTAIAKTLGYVINMRGYYNSSSNGLVSIKEMETNHIKNALLKIYRTWVGNLSTTINTRDLLRTLREGPDSAEFTDLLIELARRV